MVWAGLVWMAAGLPGQVGAPARPLTAEDAAVLSRVDSHYNHLRTLRARYAERYSGMGIERSETGVVELKRPGRMRWTTDAPAGKVYVLDGKFAWSYTPGAAEAVRTPARVVEDERSPLRFLLGHTELKKELEGVSVRPEGASFVISGQPKGLGNTERQIALTVTATGAIERLRMERVDGSVTEFVFSGVEEGVALPEADFRFAVPAGVTVVSGQAPV